jgi:hypothetical protein
MRNVVILNISEYTDILPIEDLFDGFNKICIFQLEELLKNCLDQNQTMKCISSNTI